MASNKIQNKEPQEGQRKEIFLEASRRRFNRSTFINVNKIEVPKEETGAKSYMSNYQEREEKPNTGRRFK